MKKHVFPRLLNPYNKQDVLVHTYVGKNRAITIICFFFCFHYKIILVCKYYTKISYMKIFAQDQNTLIDQSFTYRIVGNFQGMKLL